MDWIRAVLCVAVIQTAIPAAAQSANDAKPTLENAHLFVERTMTDSKFLQVYKGGSWSENGPPIKNVKSSLCTTDLSVDGDGGVKTWRIDWTKVKGWSTFCSQGGTILIKGGMALLSGTLGYNDEDAFALDFGTSELSIRVAKAFKLIYSHCDPVKDLGF